MEKKRIKRYGNVGGVSASNRGFERGLLKGVSRTIMAERSDASVVCRVDIDDEWLDTPEETTEETEPGKTIEDYLYNASDGEQYGIFKLSPRECLRLQGVMDDEIDRMMKVNSNTQLLKQAGNGISVTVLKALFSQLNISGVKPWNEMSQEEREKFIERRTKQHECSNFDGKANQRPRQQTERR